MDGLAEVFLPLSRHTLATPSCHLQATLAGRFLEGLAQQLQPLWGQGGSRRTLEIRNQPLGTVLVEAMNPLTHRLGSAPEVLGCLSGQVTEASKGRARNRCLRRLFSA